VALFELVEFDFAAQGIAMNAQQAGGAGLIALGSVQGLADKSFLEFIDGFVKQDAMIHHLADQSFKLISHDGTLR
jgi:hypothetical protein